MTTVEDLDTDFLWSFIESTKATQLASFKVLKKFILSLSKTELIQLITSYLQSKLSKCNQFNSNGLTIKQTTNKLLNNEHNQHTHNPLHTIDKRIIFKLNKNYGNKYQKKVISKTQQYHFDCNRTKRLLCIHPQVLSYSFQFLSFKELCKIQTVCIHFMRLNKHYPALTHHYIEINKTLCTKIMRYQVPLRNLSFFKHIAVTQAYCNKGAYAGNKDQERRTNLYQHLLKVIISQSKSHLDILTINVSEFHIHPLSVSWLPPFSVLYYIMHEFNTLMISKLIWKRDCFKPTDYCSTDNMLQQIASKFPQTFCKLKSLECIQTVIVASALRQYLLIPLMYNMGNTLESLDIRHFNLFEEYDNIIKVIAIQMTKLKKLSIYLRIGENEQITNSTTDNIEPVASVEELCVEFRGRGSKHHALSHLFSTFIGIRQFEVTGHYPEIDWNETLHTLIHNKRMYCINQCRDIVMPLESLEFEHVSFATGKRIMKALLDLEYFELKSITLGFYDWYGFSTQEFNDFTITHFVPFLQLYHENNAKLSNIALNFHQGADIEELYFEPILNILCNIPRCVTSLKFKLPRYDVRGSTVVKNRLIKIRESESIKLIKKLCQILENNNERKLETMSFDTISLSSYAKKYLLFLFGFENKINVVDKKYYLQF